LSKKRQNFDDIQESDTESIKNNKRKVVLGRKRTHLPIARASSE